MGARVLCSLDSCSEQLPPRLHWAFAGVHTSPWTPVGARDAGPARSNSSRNGCGCGESQEDPGPQDPGPCSAPCCRQEWADGVRQGDSVSHTCALPLALLGFLLPRLHFHFPVHLTGRNRKVRPAPTPHMGRSSPPSPSLAYHTESRGLPTRLTCLDGRPSAPPGTVAAPQILRLTPESQHIPVPPTYPSPTSRAGSF